jgi:hypothetical protein
MCGKKPCSSQNCTWGEKYKHECEARAVARMHPDRRADYFTGIEKRRGAAAANRMRQDVRKLLDKKIARR